MMKLYRFKSIRSRLSFWFILVTSLSMMIALSIVYFQRAQIIERENLNRLQALRNSKASQIEDWLNEMQTDLRVFSGNFALNLINHQHGPEFDLEKFFNEKLRIIAENYSSIIDAHLISSSNCNIVYSSNHLFAGKQIDNQNVCNNIINEPKLTISDIFYSNDLNEYTMIFAIPVWINKSMRNEFDLIFIVVIDLKKSLFKILGDNSGFKSTGEALIVNSEGYSLSELKYYDNAILKAKISAKPAMQAVSGKTGLILAKDYRGEEVMAAYTYIPATRWGLVCKEDVTELNKPLTGLLHTIITVLVISVFIIVIISYYLSTRFVSQIVLLDDVAKRMASGDLSIRSEIVSDD